MDYLYFPIKNGNVLGKVTCFYYPGTWYTLLVVDAINRDLYADAPFKGPFIVKRRWGGGTEAREYIPYSSQKRKEVHDELRTSFDTYKVKYDEHMSCFDYGQVAQDDLDAAYTAEQLNPQRFYYPPDASSASYFQEVIEPLEVELKGGYYFFPTKANGDAGKFTCFIYPGPFYKIVRVNDSNAHQHKDVPSHETYVYRYNARKDVVEYAIADKENIARVHRELHLRFEHYRRMFLDYVATLDMTRTPQEDVELAEKISYMKKQRFFQGYENCGSSEALRTFKIIKALYRRFPERQP